MTKFHADLLALIILGALAFFLDTKEKAPEPFSQTTEVQK